MHFSVCPFPAGGRPSQSPVSYVHVRRAGGSLAKTFPMETGWRLLLDRALHPGRPTYALSCTERTARRAPAVVSVHGTLRGAPVGRATSAQRPLHQLRHSNAPFKLNSVNCVIQICPRARRGLLRDTPETAPSPSSSRSRPRDSCDGLVAQTARAAHRRGEGFAADGRASCREISRPCELGKKKNI